MYRAINASTSHHPWEEYFDIIFEFNNRKDICVENHFFCLKCHNSIMILYTNTIYNGLQAKHSKSNKRFTLKQEKC